jgi:hypothetical protein
MLLECQASELSCFNSEDQEMLRFKLRTTTMAVDHGSVRPATILIPSGTVLAVPKELLNGSGLVDADWDGKRVRVFAADIRDRGDLVMAQSP